MESSNDFLMAAENVSDREVNLSVPWNNMT
jgi:hypothetical protein